MLKRERGAFATETGNHPRGVGGRGRAQRKNEKVAHTSRQDLKEKTLGSRKRKLFMIFFE